MCQQVSSDERIIRKARDGVAISLQKGNGPAGMPSRNLLI
jgi:hypothetical protein